MQLNYILRKCTGGYKLTKSQEKINYLMYMDNIKLLAKTEKELKAQTQAWKIHSQEIRMEFGIEKCAMLIKRSGKRHMTKTKRKIRMLRQKETYKYLVKLEVDIIKQTEMKENILKEYLWRTRKILETKVYSRNLIKGIKHRRPSLKDIREHF